MVCRRLYGREGLRRLARTRSREVFIPLAHPPGHAQVDFGECIGVIGDVRMKLHVFCFDPAETTEAFLDGHVAAFAFFGGVPISILYDNLKIAVARILGDGKRQRTRAFTELVSHYLFQERFGRPGKGNDKGKVEALVKYSRANFLTPVPHVPSFEALSAALEERCRARQAERAGRHEQTIGERLVADQAVLRPLPEVPFEPCDKRPAKVSSIALVRYRMNDYSVPTAYGFLDVLVKGFVDKVAIICGASEIARHPRVYGRGQFVFDPKHYLTLLEQKPGALDQALQLDIAGAAPASAASIGSPHGQSRQTRVHPGAAADRDLSRVDCRCRDDGRHSPRRGQLKGAWSSAASAPRIFRR